jgi:hypothetical protein
MQKYIGAIINYYDKHFGCEASEIIVNKYWDAKDSEIPAIAICIYRKEDTGFGYDVALTAGMSWIPMNFGETYSGNKWSTELIQYFDKIEKEDVNWLLWLSSLPYIDKFALGYGHTVSYPEPLYSESLLSNWVFLNTILVKDQELFNGFVASPYEVDLLWVVPITSAEYEVKIKNGLNTILDLFSENNHPVLLNKGRKAYVGNS